jgi:hypothetical protein
MGDGQEGTEVGNLIGVGYGYDTMERSGSWKVLN